MQVEQISYGSLKRRRMKGYQIIGKSPGVDSPMAGAFCKWAPSHNSIETVDDQPPTDAWGLSFFSLTDRNYAIARTVHGGPEYSGRGGLAVVTNALVLSSKQMAAFEFHAIDLARTAIALGKLVLQLDNDESLPAVTLTGQPIALHPPESDFTDSTPPLLPRHAVNWIARESVSLLRDERRIMIVGRCDPLPILTLLLDQLKPPERAEASFACGLKPSNRREFRLQFTQERMSPKLQKELDRSGIIAIDIAKVLEETR